MIDEKVVLGVCFRVGAKLKCDRQKVEKELTRLKILKRVSDSSKLKYEIVKIEGGNDQSILELSEDCICLIFFQRRQSTASYSSNLVTLLSLIPSLEVFYEIEFGDLYGYVIEALKYGWHNTVKSERLLIESLKERIFVLNDSNCRLSYQVVKLSKMNASIKSELSVYRQFSKKIVDAAGGGNGEGKTGIRDYILAETGIGREELERVGFYLNK